MESIKIEFCIEAGKRCGTQTSKSNDAIVIDSTANTNNKSRLMTETRTTNSTYLYSQVLNSPLHRTTPDDGLRCISFMGKSYLTATM